MSWISPTGFTDATSTWTDEPNTYDDDWNTFATGVSTGVGGPWYPTGFLELLLPSAMWINKIRFKYDASLATKKIDLDVYNVETGLWEDIIFDDYTYLVVHEVSFEAKYTDRVRVRIQTGDKTGGKVARLWELAVLQIEAPFNPPEIYVTKARGSPTPEPATHAVNEGNPLRLARLRWLRRTTTTQPHVE